MSDKPITLDELCDRLERAAISEMCCVDIMECAAARHGAPFAAVVKDTRRQGRALGLAHQIAKALKANPQIALGLGVEGIAALEAQPATLQPAGEPTP